MELFKLFFIFPRLYLLCLIFHFVEDSLFYFCHFCCRSDTTVLETFSQNMTSNEYVIPLVMAHAISLQYNDHFAPLKLTSRYVTLSKKRTFKNASHLFQRYSKCNFIIWTLWIISLFHVKYCWFKLYDHFPKTKTKHFRLMGYYKSDNVTLAYLVIASKQPPKHPL